MWRLRIFCAQNWGGGGSLWSSLFGLLHGLGFASVLGDLGLAQGQFILSLIAFNIGVELGQLAVIAAAFVIFALPLGRSAIYRRVVVIPGSVAIAFLGLWWAFERSFM